VSSRATAAGRSLPRIFDKILQRVAEALRRFVEHERRRQTIELFDRLQTRRRFRRQKSGEMKLVGGKTCARQRCQRRVGAGNDGDVVPCFTAGADETKTRIRDQRHAGVADECDALSGFDLFENALLDLLFVVIVIGDERLLDSVMGEKSAAEACVLAGDSVHVHQGRERAQADIAEIPDRCRNDIEARK
jgi:hypothetical protein